MESESVWTRRLCRYGLAGSRSRRRQRELFARRRRFSPAPPQWGGLNQSVVLGLSTGLPNTIVSAFGTRKTSRNNRSGQMGLPLSGRASTYSSKNEGHHTVNGDIYSGSGYTAALLPRSNWHAVPFGTKLKLTFMGRSVVVKVNDVGAGGESAKTHINSNPTRVLDLSRQAMAFLTGQNLHAITDHNA